MMSTQKKRSSMLQEIVNNYVRPDAEYVEKTWWKVIKNAIHDIYSRNHIGFSFEEIYRCAYNMVLHKFGLRLYCGLVTTMASHLRKLSQSIKSAQGEVFLEELNSKWEDHKRALKMIRDILGYVEKTFIPIYQKTPVYELGLGLWRDNVICPEYFRPRLLNGLFGLMLREWSGEEINRGLMTNVKQMLMDLELSDYQKDLGRMSNIFGSVFGGLAIERSRLDPVDFVQHLLDLKDRFERVITLTCDNDNTFQNAMNSAFEDFIKNFDAQSPECIFLFVVDKLTRGLEGVGEEVVEVVLDKVRMLFHYPQEEYMFEDSGRTYDLFSRIENHMHPHMENFGYMLMGDKYEDLARMYNLFRRVPGGLTIVENYMTSFIQDTCVKLINVSEGLRDPDDFVKHLLNLKDKFDKLITLAFDNDVTLQNSVNSAFEVFIKCFDAQSPEYISLFVVEKLRRGLKGVGEEDVEVVLGKVMMLFHYPQEEYVFEDSGRTYDLFRRIEIDMHPHMENFGYMLMGDKYVDLGGMYNLFRRVPGGLTIVKNYMTSFIQDTCEKLINDPVRLRDPFDFVKHLWDLKDKFNKLITLAFDNDMTLQNAMNSTFEYFIKKFHARFPEYISLFVVEKHRRGLKGVDKEDVEVVLKKIVMLFHYPQEEYVFEDSGRFYDLFHKVPGGLTIVKDYMTSIIRYTGELLINDPERLRDPVDLVQCILDFKDHFDKVITLALDNDMTFWNSLNSAFEYFINSNAQSPEFISLFVDDKLRRGLKGVGEEDVEVVLDKVMRLFRYLQEKDVFEKYYRQHLAKRLLSGKTISDDAERSLIVKLKTECGYQFTCKLEGMFTDMKTSQNTMQGFYDCHGDELGDSPKLAVQVLTTGSWPTQSSAQCNLPSEILGVYDKFQSYYLGTHPGRKLSWQTNMGETNLKATFGKGQKHELIVSTYQMCVLMLFNTADRLTYKEIEKDTEIPVPDLKRCLQSLACVEGEKVLRKEPMSKDIAEDDAFFFNDKFTSKFFKVKIGTVVAQRESEPENLETRQRVEEDRKPQIEAAIVRIMKSRKVLDHNNIVTEVTKQLQARFLPNPTLIKKRIESLIEREYLERDEEDGKLYRYVA